MKTRIKTIRILVATAVLALAVVAAHLGGNAAIGTAPRHNRSRL